MIAPQVATGRGRLTAADRWGLWLDARYERHSLRT